MNKYIDADALLKRVTNEKSQIAHQVYIAGFNDAITRVICKIDSAPTADVVEVVRCRDCKWFREATWDGVFFGGCDRSSGMDDVTPDSFCSYGEKRAEE